MRIGKTNPKPIVAPKRQQKKVQRLVPIPNWPVKKESDVKKKETNVPA